MVNGYLSIKEGFASTETNEDFINSDKINELTDDIKALEDELKVKKDKLVKEVQKELNSNNKNNTRTKMLNEDEDMIMNEEVNMDNSTEDDTEDIEMDGVTEDSEDVEMGNGTEEDTEDVEMDDEEMVEGFKNKIEEPFLGSRLLARIHLRNILKAVLLALMYYLVSSKDMILFTKPVYDLVKNTMSVNVFHTLIFLVLSYIIVNLRF